MVLFQVTDFHLDQHYGTAGPLGDFDYVGYQRSFKGSKAGDSPRQKSMKSVGTIMSPRISRAPSKAG